MARAKLDEAAKEKLGSHMAGTAGDYSLFGAMKSRLSDPCPFAVSAPLLAIRTGQWRRIGIAGGAFELETEAEWRHGLRRDSGPTA